MSCASRGLQLSEQIPSLHSEYNNPNLLGYVEGDNEIKLDNIYFVSDKKENFVKDYFKNKRSTRAIASEVYKNEFQTTKVTIDPESFGILLNN